VLLRGQPLPLEAAKLRAEGPPPLGTWTWLSAPSGVATRTSRRGELNQAQRQLVSRYIVAISLSSRSDGLPAQIEVEITTAAVGRAGGLPWPLKPQRLRFFNPRKVNAAPAPAPHSPARARSQR